MMDLSNKTLVILLVFAMIISLAGTLFSLGRMGRLDGITGMITDVASYAASQRFSMGNAIGGQMKEAARIAEKAQQEHNITLFAGIFLIAAISSIMLISYRKNDPDRRNKEKIKERIEMLEKKYKEDYHKAEGSIMDEGRYLWLEKLSDYIKEYMGKGFSREQIMFHLKTYGWQEHHIHHAMKNAMKTMLEQEIEDLKRMLR